MPKRAITTALSIAVALGLASCSTPENADVATDGVVVGIAYYEVQTPDGTVPCIAGRGHSGGISVDCNWSDVRGD